MTQGIQSKVATQGIQPFEAELSAPKHVPVESMFNISTRIPRQEHANMGPVRVNNDFFFHFFT